MKVEKNAKVLFTGGHITPAIAVLEALQSSGIQLLFVGRTYTDTHQSHSKEFELINPLVDKYISYQPPKFNRHQWLTIPIQLVRFLQSIVQAWRIIAKNKPTVIVSFGGYVALPIGLVGLLMSIPVITHEQTSVLGLSNRILSWCGAQLYVSWEQTIHVPKNSEVIGNPVRQHLLSHSTKPSWLPAEIKKPILYITGGNQGSLAINMYVISQLDVLLKRFIVIHQTGSSRMKHDYSKALHKKNTLSASLADKYYPKTWIDATDVNWLLQHSQLVISRAGANTVTELLIHQTPALLVPLPYSGSGEQQQNALLYQNLGLGLMVRQDKISDISKNLDWTPKSVDKDQVEMHRHKHAQSAQVLAQRIITCVQESAKEP